MLSHLDDVSMIEETVQKMLHYVATATELNARKREQEWGEYEVVKKFFSGRAPEACEEVEEGKGEGG